MFLSWRWACIPKGPMVLQETHSPVDSPPKSAPEGSVGLPGSDTATPFSPRADLCSFSLRQPRSQRLDCGISTSSEITPSPRAKISPENNAHPPFLLSFLSCFSSPLPPQLSKRNFCSFSWEAAKKPNACECQQAAHHESFFPRDKSSTRLIQQPGIFSMHPCVCLHVLMCIS